MTEQLHFERAELIEVPVTIGDKEYILKEADGEAGAAYEDAKMEGMKIGKDFKPIGVSGVHKAELVLVCKCLYDKETGKRVPAHIVSNFPHHIITALTTKVKEISELGGKAKDSEGNPTPDNVQKTTKDG